MNNGNMQKEFQLKGKSLNMNNEKLQKRYPEKQ